MRVYEKTFKEEAVKLSYEVGTKKASEQLGVPEGTISGWRKSKREHNESAFVGSGTQRIKPGTETEIQLMKKIKELERANEILKEALGFFAKSRKK